MSRMSRLLGVTMVLGMSRALVMGHSRFARLLSIRAGEGSMPDSEEMRLFYALGVNVARQVGGELKGMLSQEESKAMLAGFSDSMLGKVADERNVLQTYGPKLNEVLVARSNAAVEGNKKAGADFLENYLRSNPSAVRTESGLVFHEKQAGSGAKATAASTVQVHYHGTLSDG